MWIFLAFQKEKKLQRNISFTVTAISIYFASFALRCKSPFIWQILLETKVSPWFLSSVPFWVPLTPFTRTKKIGTARQIFGILPHLPMPRLPPGGSLGTPKSLSTGATLHLGPIRLHVKTWECLKIVSMVPKIWKLCIFIKITICLRLWQIRGLS